MKTKSAKIRQALQAGKTPKEIAASLKVPVQTVYTMRWKMNRNTTYEQERKELITPLADFMREELVNVEAQISRLQTIASFISVRIAQLEQNNE